MSGVLERTLGILELLVAHPQGLPLGMVAEQLNMPPSAAHRLLTDLTARGYVRQARDQGDYALTTKLVAMVLDYMSAAGIVDFAQPILNRLALESGEFVRLSVIDGDRLMWVARAQGAHRGLRYDPELGSDARLSCTASGHAWLMTMSDEEALTRVARQGFGQPRDYGPSAPTTTHAVLKHLKAARARGFSITLETFALGMASMAAPVRRPDQAPVGVLSIAGPVVRMTEARMLALGPVLLAAAQEIAAASVASPLFAAHLLDKRETEV